MIIRKAQLEDLNFILDLFEQLDLHHAEKAPDTFKPVTKETRTNDFLETLEDKDCILIVAEKENKVVGFVDTCLKEIKENDRGLHCKKYMQIVNVVVDQKSRRQHIAEKLMQYIEEQAKVMQLDHINLTVFDFNNAKFFYEYMGFETITRKMQKKL